MKNKMPIGKQTILGIPIEELFIKKPNEELLQIHKDYLDSPEKKEADRKSQERIVGTASIMHQLVGYEK
jgi:hypothetical protein